MGNGGIPGNCRFTVASAFQSRNLRQAADREYVEARTTSALSGVSSDRFLQHIYWASTTLDIVSGTLMYHLTKSVKFPVCVEFMFL